MALQREAMASRGTKDLACIRDGATQRRAHRGSHIELERALIKWKIFV